MWANDRWTEKEVMVYPHNGHYAVRKVELLSFGTPWMKL